MLDLKLHLNRDRGRLADGRTVCFDRMVSRASTLDVDVRPLRRRLRSLLYRIIDQDCRLQDLDFDHRLLEECQQEMEQYVSEKGHLQRRSRR